jgi:transcription termination factor NusB
MSDDKIAEIRARHMSETWPRLYELKVQIHDDREWLLAEVDRLRAALMEISQYETSAPAGFEWDIVVEELVEIARKALESKP